MVTKEVLQHLVIAMADTEVALVSLEIEEVVVSLEEEAQEHLQ